MIDPESSRNPGGDDFYVQLAIWMDMSRTATASMRNMRLGLTVGVESHTFGKLVKVDLAIDKVVNLPRGFAYVEFKNRSEAQEVISPFFTRLLPALSAQTDQACAQRHGHMQSGKLLRTCSWTAVPRGPVGDHRNCI